MPTNQDGEEVNADGSPITPEQEETSDWTQVLELSRKSKVKPLSIDYLAPNCVPITIPYLEVYRTDEMYFKAYESPFCSATTSTDTGGVDGASGETGTGGETGSSSGGSGSGSLWTDIANVVNNHIEVSSGKKDQYIRRLYKADNNWTAIARIVNGHRIKGNASQNTVIRAILNAKTNAKSNSNSGGASHSSKTKNSKLSSAIKVIVKRYFRSSANVTTLVNRYMSARTSKSSIGAVTNRSSVHLKTSVSPSTVNNAVYNAKHKYS